MSDVKTIDVKTGVETMRPYTDAEKAQIAKERRKAREERVLIREANKSVPSAK